MPTRSFFRRIGYAIGLAPRPRPTPPPTGRGSGGAGERARPGVRVGPGGPGHTRVLRVENEHEQGNGRRNGAGVPKEVLRQVRLIEMRTRGMVTSLFSGEYQSVFKGQGMEFAEVREYQPGDDVRNIEWNVTARMGHPYIKKYVEERELTVLLAVDLSGSEQFGTRGRFKAELATEIAAVLALSAVRNNDRVGLLVFSDHVEHFVPPRKGRRLVLRLIRDLLAFRPLGRGTDLAGALDYAIRVLPHRSIVFVLSDFLTALAAAPAAAAAAAGKDKDAKAGTEGEGGKAKGGARTKGKVDTNGGENGEGEGLEPVADERVERMLRLASKRHDVVAVTITDAAEEQLPAAGVLAVTDPESGQRLVVDTADRSTQALYGAVIKRERTRLRRLLRQLRIEEIEVRTDTSYVGPLLAFFRQRERHLRR